MHAAPDSSVVVRLDGAPWLVRYDSTGKPSNLSVAESLGWVEGFAIAKDGSLFVAGNMSAGGGQIEHLSSAGAVLGMNSLSTPFDEFNAIAATANGQVYLAVTGQLTPSNVESRVYPLGEDGTLGTAYSVSPLIPDFLAVDSTGTAFVATQVKPDDFFITHGALLLPNQATLPISFWSQDDIIASNYFAGAVPDGRGGWVFAAARQRSQGYEVDVKRVAPSGGIAWTVSQYASSSFALAAMSDSVSADLSRIPLNISASSDKGQSFSYQNYQPSSAPIGAVAIAPESIVYAASASPQHYSIARIDFPPLANVPPASCVTSAECGGGACCQNACVSDTACDTNSVCTMPSDCKGTCLQARPGATGICEPTCTTSTDCGQNFCVSGVCIPGCASAATCFSGSCLNKTDVEGVSVSVCGYP